MQSRAVRSLEKKTRGVGLASAIGGGFEEVFFHIVTSSSVSRTKLITRIMYVHILHLFAWWYTLVPLLDS